METAKIEAKINQLEAKINQVEENLEELRRNKGILRSPEETTKMLTELTGLHGYSVGSRMADEKEIAYRKGVLAALRWELRIADTLPINP